MRCYFWQCFYHCLLLLSYIFCIFICYSLVVPLLLLYLLLHGHHLTWISFVSCYCFLLSFLSSLLHIRGCVMFALFPPLFRFVLRFFRVLFSSSSCVTLLLCLRLLSNNQKINREQKHFQREIHSTLR